MLANILSELHCTQHSAWCLGASPTSSMLRISSHHSCLFLPYMFTMVAESLHGMPIVLHSVQVALLLWRACSASQPVDACTIPCLTMVLLHMPCGSPIQFACWRQFVAFKVLVLEFNISNYIMMGKYSGGTYMLSLHAQSICQTTLCCAWQTNLAVLS